MEKNVTQKDAKGWRALSRDVIKYIAMAVMLLNHIAAVFLEPGTLLYEVFTDAGYFTAITMCYFLVEGYRYTRSKKKYGTRLLAFAIISQIPFQMAFPHGGGLNMIFTLFICFLILVAREQIENQTLRTVIVMLLVLVTVIGDWALMAAVFTIMFDAWRGDRKRIWYAYGIAAVVFGGLNLADALSVYPAAKAVLCAAGSVVGILESGLVIQFLYNGKRAECGRNISKWFFYIFYPAHLLILAFLQK